MKINLHEKKYLVTSGCSFTDGFLMKEKGTWAFYLSNKLGLELHNKARGGQGNEFISNSIIGYLINNKDIRENCVVGVAWSEVTRLLSSIMNEIDQNGNPITLIDTVRPQDFLKDGKFYNSSFNKFFSDIPFCVYRTYMSIINLNNFLELNKIPYFYIDAINVNKVELLNYSNEFKFKNSRANHSTMQSSYPIHFTLSPIINRHVNETIFNNFLKIGNYDTILDLMHSDYNRYEEGNPGHPNDIASNEVAQIIYNQIV